MPVYIQWTRADPQDWEPVTLNDWRRIASKNEPTGGEVIDNSPGWVFGVCAQGVTIEGYDHYHAGIIDGEPALTAWNDDPEDWPVGTRRAVRWRFGALRPDPKVGGVLNTFQTLTVWAEDPDDIAFWSRQSTTAGPVTVLPWADFVPPHRNLTRHGIWMPDELVAAHFAVRSPRDWREG